MTDPSATSLIFAVGLQSRLMPHVDEGDGVLSNSLRLLRAAKLVGRPAVFAEHAHCDLGETVAVLRPYAQARLQTDAFDATQADYFLDHVPVTVSKILLVGAEAHDCIMQTGLSLLGMGKSVSIAADAVGSRRSLEKHVALSRLAQRGAEIVTAEMAMFEWLGSRAAPGFRDLMDFIGRPGASVRREGRLHFRDDPDAITERPETGDVSGPVMIGALLRHARLENFLTLKQVATQSRCSLSQLSKIENNKAVPTLPLLRRLSDVLGRDIKSFLAPTTIW